MSIEKLIYKIVSRYYWLYVIVSVIAFVSTKDLNAMLAFLTIIAGILSFEKARNRMNFFDFIVLIYILYSFISYGFSSYSGKLYYAGIRYQLIFTMFYFIGRNSDISLRKFYCNIKWPMVFAFISGLILYVWSPAWYLAPKMARLSQWANDYQIHEATRLSSFWIHSYFCGYAALIYLMFTITNRVIKNKIEKFFPVKIALALLVLFFAQQRVSIFFFIFFFLILLLYAGKKRLQSFGIMLKLFFWSCTLGTCIFLLLINYFDESLIDYIASRSINSDDNFLLTRIHQFDNFLPFISFFGQGLGRFGHAAIALNLPCISDNEYMRILCELGFVGLVLIMTLFGGLLLKALKNFKHLHFEGFIILFYLIAMIGAAPLEMSSQQNFMLWFCLGRIRQFSIKDEMLS